MGTVIFNPLTGEKFDATSITTEEASTVLKEILIRKKQFEDIEKALKGKLEEKISEAVDNNEKTILGYWVVQDGRLTFDKPTFLKRASKVTKNRYLLAKEDIRNIENQYLKKGKPFIKFPRI